MNRSSRYDAGPYLQPHNEHVLDWHRQQEIAAMERNERATQEHIDNCGYCQRWWEKGVHSSMALRMCVEHAVRVNIDAGRR